MNPAVHPFVNLVLRAIGSAHGFVRIRYTRHCRKAGTAFG